MYGLKYKKIYGNYWKTLAIKGFLCYNATVYAKNTQRGFLGWCPKRSLGEKKLCGRKKPKTED
jgi:hypothetical protein